MPTPMFGHLLSETSCFATESQQMKMVLMELLLTTSKDKGVYGHLPIYFCKVFKEDHQ